MPKDQRSSVAVSRETAAALKAVADEVGATVGELLHFAALKPAILQRAYLQGDRAVKAARNGQARDPYAAVGRADVPRRRRRRGHHPARGDVDAGRGPLARASNVERGTGAVTLVALVPKRPQFVDGG